MNCLIMTDSPSGQIAPGLPRARWPWQRSLQTRLVMTYGLIFVVVLVLLVARISRLIYTVQLDQAEHGLEVEAFLAANALEDPLSGYQADFDEYERYSEHERESDRSSEQEDDDSNVEDEGEEGNQTVLVSSTTTPVAVRLQQLADWYASDADARVTILNPRGEAIADSHFPVSNVPNQIAYPEIQAAQAGTEQHDVRIESLNGAETLFAAAPVQQGRQILGYIRLARPMSEVVAPIRMLMIDLVMAGGIALVVSTAAGLVLARRLLRPIRMLEHAAVGIAAGDLAQRAPVENADEVGQLAVAFNIMVDKLRRLIEQQRLFIGNASHELRTPPTNIKLRSEALATMDLDKDRMVAQRYIAEIDSEADRLGRMANMLLDLNRLDDMQQAPLMTAIDIAPIILDMSRLIGARVRNADLTFRAHIPVQLPPIRIRSDDVEVILANLLDNAIKYTPPGGSLQLTASENDVYCFLQVADNGVGIPPEDLPHIFDRFYRVDKARSRNTTPDSLGSGSGLGLAIVKALVKQNAGHIDATSAPGQGTTFTVRFPIATP